MSEKEMGLCQRILEVCREQRWYAGEEYNTARFRTRDRRYDEYINAQGNLMVVDNDPDNHPRKSSFAYPPASEEQLLATEQALGFPLPPLLRVLYVQLANGGFGPGYGLIGAMGGFDEAGNLVEMYHYHSRRAELIDLVAYQERIEAGKPLELPDTMWPREMLYLCDWGEAKVSCFDCETGSVFLVHMGAIYRGYVLERQAHSLQTWLEQWLEGWPKKVAAWWEEPEEASSLEEFDPFLDGYDE